MLVQLMYLGECQVAEDQLDKFFDLALELGVEGIFKEDCEKKSEDVENEQRNKDLDKVRKDETSEGGDDIEIQLKSGTVDELQSLFLKREILKVATSVCTKKELETDLPRNTSDILHRFSCDLCGKGFYYIYQLNEHKEIKHEGKRYNCDLCDKSWSKEKQLVAHKQIKHEGIRYDCDDCAFKSVSRKNLKSHRDFIHAGIGVDCDICENKYSTTWAVTSHKFKVHGISKEVFKKSP